MHASIDQPVWRAIAPLRRCTAIRCRGPLLAAALMLGGTAAGAGEADVVAVEVQRSADGRYRFDVTVRHADEGWEHYADAWQVVAPDGTVLGTRTLLHPHEHEQPFTRSLDGVVIPEGIPEVTVQARDSVHGLGGREQAVAVPR